MQYNMKLKKNIEETFKIKCKDDCKYIYASSSEELARKIRQKIQTAYKVKDYYFLTNSSICIGGLFSNVSATLRNLGYMISDIKIGYVEIMRDSRPNENIETFAFGILDTTKECIKMICSPDEKKNVELSTYTDFVSLQDAVINIIGRNSKYNWHYMILRENENSFGRIEGMGEKRIKSENEFFINFEKYPESITAVSIRELPNDIETNKNDEKLKHYVLFMV